MAIETERKYLIFNTEFLDELQGASLVQGYLHEKGATTRVRISDNHLAWLTIKGSRDARLGRPEYEYAIPLADALQMLTLCEDRLLRKTRYEVEHEGHVWHVDVYEGAHQGLVTAEIELEDFDDPFSIPSWLGPEVTHDKRFTNKKLAIAGKTPLKLAA